MRNKQNNFRPDKPERLKYHVDYPQDTDFSAYARLLQSKWRQGKGYPELKMGSFLDVEYAKKEKSNFLTPKIQKLVEDKIAESKKTGGLISEPRIWNNLLSSQPLCFNLFGELVSDDWELATEFFHRLFPEIVDRVNRIEFEYSPGRGDKKYTEDHSAFDVFVEYTKEEKKGFIGIEVKYAESLKEESRKKAEEYYKPIYKQKTESSGLFVENSVEQLRYPPLSQIWRDHLLSIALRKDYDEGFFVFLYPSKNLNCQDGVDNFRKLLKSQDERINGFCPRYLDDFIEILHNIVNQDWTTELKERYLGR